MEERIRTLKGALLRIESTAKLARDRVSETNARTALANIRRQVETALYPHKSWCRGDHSEGACAPPEPEVDHGE